MKVIFDFVYIKTKSKSIADRIKQDVKDVCPEAIIKTYELNPKKGLFVGYTPNCHGFRKLKLIRKLKILGFLYWLNERFGIAV